MLVPGFILFLLLELFSKLQLIVNFILFVPKLFVLLLSQLLLESILHDHLLVIPCLPLLPYLLLIDLSLISGDLDPLVL